MGNLKLPKIFCLLFLLISASLPSTSYAGRRPRYVNYKLVKEAVGSTYEGNEQLLPEEEKRSLHERLLTVNTKDYGTYDPAPTFAKPSFKPIPN